MQLFIAEEHWKQPNIIFKALFSKLFKEVSIYLNQETELYEEGCLAGVVTFRQGIQASLR
jgi:hypothetical protein